MTDLGSLPGGGTSEPRVINEKGDVAGAASNGVFDPSGILGGWPEVMAVLYKDGQVTDLGTLGGNESAALAINNRGVVVGLAQNTIPDPDFGQQLRAFRWQNEVMQDLGTLGTGADALANAINKSGQIAGFSFVSDVSITDPFLWENGTMIDLGGLGGTASDTQEGPFMNNRGQVVGDSNLSQETSITTLTFGQNLARCKTWAPLAAISEWPPESTMPERPSVTRRTRAIKPCSHSSGRKAR